MNGLLRLRLAGVPVLVRPGFWAACAVLGGDRLLRPHLLLVWVGVVFASVLLHELGHAWVLRRLGHRPTVELNVWGGQTAAPHGLGSTAEILVSVAGPLAGLVVGLPLLIVRLILPGLVELPVLGTLLSDLVWVNVGWSLLNLLPVLPLDGGHVLRALLRRAGTMGSARRAHHVSIAVGALVALAALLLGEPYVACGAAALGVYNLLAARTA